MTARIERIDDRAVVALNRLAAGPVRTRLDDAK
jgi:hypothetical protein